MMSNILRCTAFLAIMAVLSIDILNSYRKASTGLLSWYDLILCIFLVFIGVGDRIAKLAITMTGITIQQTVKAAVKDVSSLAALKTDTKATHLEEILTSTTGRSKDVWSKMIVYRLAMRILLRRLCGQNGMTLGDATAFVQMLGFVKSHSLLAVDVQAEIEKVRNVSFFFEWGTGSPPSESDIKSVLQIAPKVLHKLAKAVGIGSNE